MGSSKVDDITRHRVPYYTRRDSKIKDVIEGSSTQKIRDFYLSAMDTALIEESGFTHCSAVRKR